MQLTDEDIKEIRKYISLLRLHLGGDVEYVSEHSDPNAFLRKLVELGGPDNRTPLPEGWAWSRHVRCGAARGKLFCEMELDGLAVSCGCDSAIIPLDVVRAVMTEYERLTENEPQRGSELANHNESALD